MKKVLSIMLVLCMLLTMVAIPAVAAEDVNAGKLYYKFDFSEDTLYTDYANPVLPDGVTYEDFAAVSTAGTNVIDYGKIGDKDGLYIRAGGSNLNVVFTPLKEDGTPVVLEPGKDYVVEWEFAIARSTGCWARPHIEPFTTLDGATSNAGDRYAAYYTTTAGEGEEATETKTYLSWSDAGSYLGFGSLITGPQLAYWGKAYSGVSKAKDYVILDAYVKGTETVEGAEGEEATEKVTYTLHDGDQYDNGTSASGAVYSITQTVSIASEDELADYNVAKNEDGSYSFGEVAYNNFLGLSLPGGYGNYYYAGYDEKSIENVQDEAGNWYHRAYAEYYVTGLRVYEADYVFSTVTCIDSDGETVIDVVPGEEISYPDVPTSASGDVMWSLSATEYVPVPTVATAEDITVYAYNSGVVGFENYAFGNAYVKNVWLTNSMVSDEKVYSGSKSLKFHNYNLNVLTAEPADWASAWNKYYSYDTETDTFAKLGGELAPIFEAGKYYKTRGGAEVEQGAFLVSDLGPSKTDGELNVYSYTRKVSFKYFVPEGNTGSFTVKAVQFNAPNIWWGTSAVSSNYSIAATPTGEWKTFEMLIKADELSAVGGNSGPGNQVVALKVNPSDCAANARNATIYIDDVTIEDIVIDNKVVYHYNDGVTEDEVITEGLETGVAYNIDRIPANIPEGKYFAGWYTDETCTVPAGSSVMAGLTGTINLYAKYADYASSADYDLKDASIKDVNNLAYMKDGVYKTTVTEGGWQIMEYTEDGVYVAKTTGNANAFNPTKTDAVVQRNNNLIKQGYSYLAGTDAAGSTKYADMAIGEETTIGWSAYTGFVIKDADGNAFIPKANTSYKVTVKYNVTNIGPGNTAVQLVAGRKLAYAETGANAIGADVYGTAVSEEKNTFTEAGEQTVTYTINTGAMADAVPVLSLHILISGFKAKKVAEANGVASYTLDDGSTVYPFEITGKFEGYVEEVSVIELDSSITMVEDENVTTIKGVKGDAITYPELPSSLDYDYVWSLSESMYLPAPTVMDGNGIVYAYKNPVIGLENYKGHAFDKGVNISISDEKAYEGNKSFRYEDIDYAAITAEQALAVIGEGEAATTAWLTSTNQFFWKNALVYDEETETFVKVSGDTAPEFEEGKYYRNRNNNKDHGLALWKLEAGKAYKVTYKYYVEKISGDINVSAVISNENIWTPSAITAGNAVISKDSAVGEWLDGEIYLNNTSAFTRLYMLFSNPAVASGDVLYFDNFAVEEVQAVTFVIEEGMTPEGVTAKDGVITSYFAMDAEITAPVVIDADGNPVEIWKDAEGNTVTEFISGGVYTAYVAPAFIYGDCDNDGKVDTTDLAALKLYLAGSGEVGLGGDCNGDGDINTTDLAALKLFLAGSGALGPQN